MTAAPIITGIIILVLIGLLLFIHNHFKFYKNEFEKVKNTVSFNEALRLTGLPIIPIVIQNKTFNMILDTGSVMSYIDENVYNSLFKKQPNRKTKKVIGIAGEVGKKHIENIEFECNGIQMSDSFLLNDFTETFGIIKKDTGVSIHGLLGSNFFDAHNYIIDYNNKSFYARRFDNKKDSKLFSLFKKT